MEQMLKIGVIVKPQGIKGELKVAPLTDDANRFKQLKKVIIDGQEFKVAGAKIGAGAVFLALFGVQDRNVAETFRNKEIFVKREDAVTPKKDHYFIVDILGCKVVTETGVEVGVVTDVTTAKTDIFTLDCNGRVMRFPFLKDLLKSVDVENKRVIVKEKRLKEVSCYED